MSTITINITVRDLDSVRDLYTHIKVYRSITESYGPYTEITDSSTRLILVDGTVAYSFDDATGEEFYWYKISYFNSGTSAESAMSEAMLGSGNSALDIISVAELKANYLFGLDLTNDSGDEYPDSLYEWSIRSAVSWIEHRLDIPLTTKYFSNERHDYYREDYSHYIWIPLDHYPVIEVSQVQMVLPGEQVVQTFDEDWIHLERESGQLQLVPGTGTAGSILMGASGAWLPLIYGNNKFIPGVFRVNYTAGFAVGEVPPVLRDLVGKVSSFGPLNIAGDLLGGAGIASQSLSLDGLSQSFNTTSSATNSGYGSRILQYEREIKQIIPTLQRFYKGLRMVVV